MMAEYRNALQENHGILLSNKKKCPINTQNSKNEPQKYGEVIERSQTKKRKSICTYVNRYRYV